MVNSIARRLFKVYFSVHWINHQSVSLSISHLSNINEILIEYQPSIN